MGVIAVAGGTGGMGKAIVEQLELIKRYPFIILSRKVIDVIPTLAQRRG